MMMTIMMTATKGHELSLTWVANRHSKSETMTKVMGVMGCS